MWKLQLMWDFQSVLNSDEDLFLANLINCTFIQLRLSSALMLWSTERGIIQFKPLSIHSSDTDTVNNLRGFSFPLVSKWSRLQSISEAGVNITQWDKGKPLRRRKTSQMTTLPHVVTYTASRLFVFPCCQQLCAIWREQYEV